MHQIQLADQLYEEAQRRAIEAGFTTVDEFVADIVAQELELSAENRDHVFTPEVIRELDRVSRHKAGGKRIADEVKEHFRTRSEAWRADQTTN